MLLSDTKTSIRAAQIFALFLGTPPIKPKWRGKSHYGRQNEQGAAVSGLLKGCEGSGDRSHSQTIDAYPQDRTMQNVSLKSTCLAIQWTLDASSLP